MMKPFNLLLSLLVWGTTTIAQNTPPTDSTVQIQTVNITYQAQKRTPVTFLNLGGTDLRVRSIGQEPAFLLAETPSVTAFSDAGSNNGYAYIRMRGIDQTRINISLDGVPINEPEDQGAFFSNYPDLLNSMDKVQVQRGVGTTKNGVASYGGSIQMFSPNLSESQRTTVGAGYGNYNTYRAFGMYSSGLRNGRGMHLRISHVGSDGYKRNAFNNAQSIYWSGGIFKEKYSWKFNVLAGRNRNGLAWFGVPEAAIKVDPRTNANINEKDDFGQGLAQVLHTRKINSKSSIQGSLYYTYAKGNYDFNLDTWLGGPDKGELYNYAFLSHWLGFFANHTYTKGALQLTTGVHLNQYTRSHTGSFKVGEQSDRLYRNIGDRNEASTFVKAEYTVDKINFFADVQYRYSAFLYEGALDMNSLRWHFLNPKAGVGYALRPNATLYYSIGRTSREPTRNDIFGGNDDPLMDTNSVNSVLLFAQNPESVIDHELGLRQKWDKLSLDANLYFMDFKNELVLNGKFGPNGLPLTSKIDQSYRTGIEVTANYQINSDWTLVHNSSFNRSLMRDSTITFTPILTPAAIVNQEIRYQTGPLQLALIGRYQHQSFIDFANDNTIDSYFLLNARAGYTWRGLEVSLFANNLTNTTYYNNGSMDFDGVTRRLFVQMPRNFYAAVKYSF